MPAAKKKTQKTKYQLWYEKNKEAIAARRRERYRTDRKYRERNLKACREWRAKRKPWAERKVEPRTYLLISEFAQEVGCSAETLRNLEAEKLIPRTTNGVARRRYHPSNVARVSKLVTFRRDHHYSEPKYKEKLKALVKDIKSNWTKA